MADQERLISGNERRPCYQSLALQMHLSCTTAAHQIDPRVSTLRDSRITRPHLEFGALVRRSSRTLIVTGLIGLVAMYCPDGQPLADVVAVVDVPPTIRLFPD
ncbi:hypothetical protein [Klebsiella pneumoniae]|uniref:hypothetical protein n=1 Tax=Klebsiella pneumoniae TaxID=573 RepID=UPI003C12FD96